MTADIFARSKCTRFMVVILAALFLFSALPHFQPEDAIAAGNPPIYISFHWHMH